MPVIDGVFVPRTVLCAAERQVDWVDLYDHVTRRRLVVETNVAPVVKRAARVHAITLLAPRAIQDQAADTLARHINATARYGADQATRELRKLRTAGQVAAHYVPDTGDQPEIANLGLSAVFDLIRRRSRASITAISAAVAAWLTEHTDESDAAQAAGAAAVAARQLHNHVLELVGEALNLGRAAGALTQTSRPPVFALRSEQLDKGTCTVCSRLHGQIVEVGSPSFYAYMPPAGCQGGGRCRGVYVFADGTSDLRGPVTSPGPQPGLPAIPPVTRPARRRAA